MKKVFFALFAVVIAISGSAFTDAKSTDPLKLYGNTGTNYSQRSTEEYIITDCSETSPKLCAYQVTELGRSTVTASSYTEAEMIAFKVALKVVEAPGSDAGVYQAP